MVNRYSRVAGTGSYLPEKVLTNADLEKLVDTSDEWIRTRTGIERRHIAADHETSSSMAEHAARRARKAAGQTPADVDFIVVGSGGGSLCAALVLRAAGKSVLVLEKTNLIGGTTATSGGVMWIPNNRYMRAEGVPDSRENATTGISASFGSSRAPAYR